MTPTISDDPVPTYRLLGLPGVRRNRTLRLSTGPRQTLLLCLLALSPGRAVDGGRLVEALWRGAPPRSPSNTLQCQVSRLRRLVGTDTVQLTANGYVLSTSRSDVDATAFEDKVLQARRMLAAGAYATSMALVGAADRLWAGEPMAQLHEDPTVRRAAERLGELRLDALVTRVEAEIAVGMHTQAVPALRSLLEQHPLREDLWALLVTALYRSGRTADALHAHRRARSILVRELGLEPGRRLRELERDILAGAPHLDEPPHPCSTHAPLLAGPAAGGRRATLPPWAGPLGPPAGWQDYPAPRLFLDRLQLADPIRSRPAPDPRQGADIVRLCRLLEGDPLAIELAAVSLGRAGLAGLSALVERHVRAGEATQSAEAESARVEVTPG